VSETVLLDTSALLALLFEEPGAETVQRALSGPAWMSSVNMTEAVSKMVQRGDHPVDALADILSLGVVGLPFEPGLAAVAGNLAARHRRVLSLGDAACLATAADRNLPVLTADRAWASLGLAQEIRLIR